MVELSGAARTEEVQFDLRRNAWAARAAWAAWAAWAARAAGAAWAAGAARATAAFAALAAAVRRPVPENPLPHILRSPHNLRTPTWSPITLPTCPQIIPAPRPPFLPPIYPGVTKVGWPLTSNRLLSITYHCEYYYYLQIVFHVIIVMIPDILSP